MRVCLCAWTHLWCPTPAVPYSLWPMRLCKCTRERLSACIGLSVWPCPCVWSSLAVMEEAVRSRKEVVTRRTYLLVKSSSFRLVRVSLIPGWATAVPRVNANTFPNSFDHLSLPFCRQLSLFRHTLLLLLPLLTRHRHSYTTHL